MKGRKLVLIGIIAFGVLQFVAFVLALVSKLSFAESFRIVFGSVFVLFLPGWVWSFVFFDNRREKKIDLIERIALSFALSIALVPLTIFYLNLLGMKVSAFSSFFVVLFLILIGLGIVFFRGRRGRI